MSKHSVLAEIEAQLEGVETTFDAWVGKARLQMRVLTRSEETRARSLVDADNLLTAFADSNVPQLAYAVVSVNETPADQLFSPEGNEDRQSFEANPERWRRRQLADWIAAQPTVVTEQLWLAYLQAKDKMNKALKDLQNFSERTPSGS